MKERIYNLNEFAKECGVDPQAVRDWVKAGRITPVIAGQKGRGRSHWFSAKQIVRVKRYQKLRAAVRKGIASLDAVREFRLVLDEKT